MTPMLALADRSLLAFGGLLFIVQILAHESGFRIGRRRRMRQEDVSDGVGVLVGGVLALLAFVLALTLTFASDRFNERRVGALDEANAIGTAWLRAEAVGGPEGTEIANLLQRYLELRIDYVKAPNDQAAIAAIDSRTNALQTRIWGYVAQLVRGSPTTISASLMASLNDAFDMTTAERFAFAQRLPVQIFWLLLALTMVGMAVLGYQLGLKGPPMRLLAVLLTLVWAAVIVVIVDLASPRIGGLRASTATYEWTLSGFKGGIPLPAPAAAAASGD